MASHRTVVCLGVLTVFLAIACCVLTGLFVWREIGRGATSGQQGATDLGNLTEIQLNFPGYFRTPQEQAEVERISSQLIHIPVTNLSAVHTRCFVNGFCELRPLETSTATPMSVTGSSMARRRRQITTSSTCDLDSLPEDQLTFHGCCISYSGLPITPDTLPTGQPGEQGDLEIVQFSPNLNQYFQTEECCQAKDCTSCQCSQTYYVTSAVVVLRAANGGVSLVTRLVRVPGCCQCLNLEAEPAGQR